MSMKVSALALNATVTADNQKTTITDKLIQGASFPLTGDALEVLTLPEVRYVAGVYGVAGFAGGCIAERNKIKRALPNVKLPKAILGIY